jgi:glycosyltransferase involved in cell wall biosynthesis
MTEQPTIDVLLPVFNGASTVKQAVESILNQTLPSLRIIIVDDGSTDATPQLLSTLAQQDPRIAILTRKNGGIVEALNAGLEQCTSEFVARQDADDVSDLSRLEVQLAYLLRHPDCVAVSGGVRHIDEAGRSLGTVQLFPSPDRADPSWAPSREPYLSHPFLLMRRTAVRSVGGYRYAHNSEDTDLYWRLLELGRLHNLDFPLGSYRMHGDSVSGGSIVNGRIMAVNSQLVGLSALRRRAGRPDIRFEKKSMVDYRGSPRLASIYELVKAQLDAREATYLRIAAGAKLLELASYRPYELDADDCLFIRDARREWTDLSVANRDELDRLTAASAARLLGKGLIREAAMLAPPSLYASVFARLVAMSLPGRLKRWTVSKLRN